MAFKIFELGLKKFSGNAEFILAYLGKYKKVRKRVFSKLIDIFEEIGNTLLACFFEGVILNW